MRIFFYGLFMDTNILKEQGVTPSEGTPSFVNGYGLRIGERALLVQSPNELSYGLTFTLKDTEVFSLYSEPSVQDYTPFELTAFPIGRDSEEHAYCYNLPASKMKGSNQLYANKLACLAKTLNFPESYVAHIMEQT